MMMIPRRKNEFDLFDEMFNDPFFTRGENKLMRTDIKEKNDHYELEVDLPGYEKENIKIELSDGYLTIHASMNKSVDDEKDSKYVNDISGLFFICSIIICNLLSNIDFNSSSISIFSLVSLEVSFIASSYPVNAAKGANCAERAYKDICGCFFDT